MYASVLCFSALSGAFYFAIKSLFQKKIGRLWTCFACLYDMQIANAWQTGFLYIPLCETGIMDVVLHGGLSVVWFKQDLVVYEVHPFYFAL